MAHVKKGSGGDHVFLSTYWEFHDNYSSNVFLICPLFLKLFMCLCFKSGIELRSTYKLQKYIFFRLEQLYQNILSLCFLLPISSLSPCREMFLVLIEESCLAMYC